MCNNAEDCEQYSSNNICCTCRNREWYRLYNEYKAKEQECEKLRQYHNKCCEEFEKEKKEWLEKYNQVSRDFYSGKYCNAEKRQQLDQLKAEIEILKQYNTSKQASYEQLQIKCNDLVWENRRLETLLNTYRSYTKTLENRGDDE